jgi:hypothetical protein
MNIQAFMLNLYPKVKKISVDNQHGKIWIIFLWKNRLLTESYKNIFTGSLLQKQPLVFNHLKTQSASFNRLLKFAITVCKLDECVYCICAVDPVLVLTREIVLGCSF